MAPRASAAGGVELPWRGPGVGRPALPLPPASPPLLGPARRLRKRWRYVGVFCERFMLCAARAEVGPALQTFWALVDREDGAMLERTRKPLPWARGEVWSEGGDGRPWQIGSDEGGVLTRVESSRGSVRAELRVGEGRWAEAVCPSGEPGGWVWTRKRVAPVRCRIELPGRSIETEAWGIEDESAGYHPRHTIWRWSAGVGVAAGGRRVGWNLVSGVNDPPERSERAIWVGGEVSEPGPVTFDDDLDGLSFADGNRLGFRPEAERRATENLGLVRFDYRQPFGTFTGTLEGGLELECGWGVMEHHDAVW